MLGSHPSADQPHPTTVLRDPGREVFRIETRRRGVRPDILGEDVDRRHGSDLSRR